MWNDELDKKINRKLSEEKIIVGVNNNEVKINVINSYIWAFPLAIVLGMIFSIGIIVTMLTSFQKLIALFIFLVALIATLIIFFSQSYKLYFENNYLIIKNKLGIKKCFDIKKYPRMYILTDVQRYQSSIIDRWKYSKTYYLNIEQNDTLVRLNMGICGFGIINKFIDNLEMKSEKETNLEEWESSAGEEENFMFDCMRYLNSRTKVVGIKDINQSLNIKKGSYLNSIFLLFLVIICSCIIVWLKINRIDEIIIWFILFILLFVCLLIREKNKNTFKVRYKNDGKIKLNNYLLNYKSNELIFKINVIHISGINKKYNYSLAIQNGNRQYGIWLNGIEREKFNMFLNNIIFE